MSLDRISPELFDKLTSLAALSLSPAEREYLRGELNHQLAAVKELSEIPLDESIEPSLHGLDCPPKPPRPDHWQRFPQPDQILAQAPESEDGMFAVPDVALADKEAK